jgi:hypothetical protein
MWQLIADAVTFKEDLAMDHDDGEEVNKKWSVFGRPFLAITSKYAMHRR